MTSLCAIKPHDLEPEMESILDAGKTDIESVIMRFGHGECHSLSYALYATYGCPVIALISKDDDGPYPVHSFALLPNGLGLDAYGIHEPALIAERYHTLAGFNSLDNITAVEWTAEHLDPDACLLEGDLPSDVLCEFSIVLAHLGLELESVYQIPYEHATITEKALQQCNNLLNAMNINNAQ